MKSVKYKFSSDITADCLARHYLTIYLNCIFCGFFFFRIPIGSTQFTTFFQFAVANSSVREVEFCTIVIHPRIQSLHMQTQRGCLRTKINIYPAPKIRSEKSTPSESPKLRTTTNPEISKHKIFVSFALRNFTINVKLKGCITY